MITKYEGPANYVFVSYSHKDKDYVENLLNALEENDVRLWYDEHIESTDEWRASIETHLIKCCIFICYISDNYIESKYCIKELCLADKMLKDKSIIPIIANDYVDLKRHGVSYTIANYQETHASKFSTTFDLVNFLCNEESVKQCTLDGNVALHAGWGPERKMYTHSDTIQNCVFNSLLDNVALGDERAFVRIAEITEHRSLYQSEIIIKPGCRYEVRIYYHNNADICFNDKQWNRSGVAREVWIASRFSKCLSLGEPGEISAVLMWQDFDLNSSRDGFDYRIWSSVLLLSTSNVNLLYENGSLRIYNDFATNGTELPAGDPYNDEMHDGLFGDGTYLGLDSLDGMILGGPEFSGHVCYTLKAVEA